MMHRISENSGTSITAERTPTAEAPTKRPNSAVMIGRPIATTEPNATSSTMIATPMPISSLLGSSPPSSARGPVNSVSTPAARAVSAATVASSKCVDRQRVDGVREVDVRGAAVGAQRCRLGIERVGDARDVGAGGELLSDPFDGRVVWDVVEPAGVDVEHDPCGLPATARESLVEDVDGSLRLGTGNSERVRELATGGALSSDDGDRDQQPDADHTERVPGAAAAESEEKCAHGNLLDVARPMRDDVTIEEGADAPLHFR